MINQELARQWIAEMKNPDHKKSINYLHSKYGECCLGLYCRTVKKLNLVQPSISKTECSSLEVKSFEGAEDYPKSLSPELARELNITKCGELTDQGRLQIRNHFNLIEDSLTMLNDKSYKFDKDFLNMAKVIEHLCDVEKNQGIECFEPFANNFSHAYYSF